MQISTILIPPINAAEAGAEVNETPEVDDSEDYTFADVDIGTMSKIAFG